MRIKDHTKHLFVSLAVLGAFATTGISAYKILQYPANGFSTGENYNEVLSNRNKASASDSVTILSLADKSGPASSTLNATFRNAVTLCSPFPQKIIGYALGSTKVTNTPSVSGHGNFFSPKEKKTIEVNPDERIRLEYTQLVSDNVRNQNAQSKINPETANVQVFRYTVFNDLQRDFMKTLDLTDAHIETKVIRPTDKNATVQYVFKNENTLIVVTGKREADLRRIAEQVGGSCEGKDVFKSGIPRGYVAWRTTDTDTVNRTEYVKVADSDITLILDTVKFGTEILITDVTAQDNLGLGDLISSSKYRVFSIPTINEKGKVRAMQDVHLFAVKSKEAHLLMNALRNRQTQILGKSLVDTKRDTYQGLYTAAAKNIFNYNKVDEEGKRSTSTEYIYMITRKNTSFAFVYSHSDFGTVESLVDNLK